MTGPIPTEIGQLTALDWLRVPPASPAPGAARDRSSASQGPQREPDQGPDPDRDRPAHGPGQAPAGTTVGRLEAVIARSRRAVVVSVVSSCLLILASILEPYIWTYGGEIYEQVLTSFAILNPLRSPASDDVREILGGELMRHRHRHAC